MGRHILVTGGAGFIGTNFVHSILQNHPDDQVTVLDKLTYAGNLKNLEAWRKDSRFHFVHGDITDAPFVNALFQDQEFTQVAHFAAESHVDRSILGPEAFVRTNVLGTFTLLEAARAAGWNAEDPQRLFLHVSTDEVFGSLPDTGYFVETTAYQPNSPYSASKAGSDHLVRAYFHTYGLPTAISNCSNNYGPYQFPEKLIPLMVINCLGRKALPVYGEGTNVRDWLFVEDHCAALERILEKGVPGETYNIGGRNEWRNIDIVKHLCALMDELHPNTAPHAELISYVPDRPGHDHRYAIDPTKIESELGWRHCHSFEDGLRVTAAWYLENREWWEEILSGNYQQYYQQQYPAG